MSKSVHETGWGKICARIVAREVIIFAYPDGENKYTTLQKNNE